MQPADAILKLIETIGDPREVDLYLQIFRSAERERFAAIVVDAEVARHAFDAVALDLRFLAALDLTPIVVLGVFAGRDARDNAERLAARLVEDQVEVAIIEAGGPDLAGRLRAMARAGTLPIVPFGTAKGDSRRKRFRSLGALVAELETRKLIYLSRFGGVRRDGHLVPFVNLASDNGLIDGLDERERFLFEEARRLVLDVCRHKLVVTLTSPLDLLKELFTVRGAGTMLRRGANILSKRSPGPEDIARLAVLLEASFGRPVSPAFCARPLAHLYHEESFRGAAALADTELGGYLSKFVVEPAAQGEGIGQDLWEAVRADWPVVFWRARPQNPIRSWYARLADGVSRQGAWDVFWSGLPTDRIPAAIAHALAQPVDFR